MTTIEPTFEILPLAVTVRGEVLTSNLSDFCESVSRSLAQINTELVTDADFADAKEMVKTLKAAEQSIEAAKVRVLEGAGSVLAVLETLDDSRDNISRTRLTLDKKVKEQGEKRREDLIAQAVAKIAHPWRKERFEANCRAAIKGKSSFEIMMSELEKLVGGINMALADNRQKLADFAKEHREIILEPKVRMEMELEQPAILEQRLDALVEHARLAREREEAERKAKEAEAKLAASQGAKTEAPNTSATSSEHLGQAPNTSGQPAGNATPEPLPESTLQLKTVLLTGQKATIAKILLDSFATIKAARARLTDPDTVKKTQVFAEGVGALWNDFLQP